MCFLPSLKEFLPLGFMKVKNVEKKIFVDHKALMGTSEIDSKYKYVKLARGLPTFGVHFFLVKVSPPFFLRSYEFIQSVAEIFGPGLTNTIKLLSYPLSWLSL